MSKGVDPYETSFFSQRSVPPPRTLVPRILAALTAGAVTLGALPYAYAESVTHITENTNGTVAGSTDGTSATIIVGTEGGGEVPHIGKDTGDDHTSWGKVYGASYSTDENDTPITLTNSKAIVYSGKMRGIFGAYSTLYGGGTARIINAGAEVKDVTMTTVFTDEYIAGSVANVLVQPSSTQAVAEVKQCYINITGGNFESGPGSIAGGRAESRVWKDGCTASSEATAEENTATITGGRFAKWASFYGGKAFSNPHTTSATAKALKNHLIINSDQQVDKLFGGYAYAVTSGGPLLAQANENTLNAKTEARSFCGGYARGPQRDSPAPSGTAEANRNKVWIAVGSRFTKYSAGGCSSLVAKRIQTLNSTANENEVSIAGGTFEGEVNGGGAAIYSIDPPADSEANAAANRNKLWANAGTFKSLLISGNSFIRSKGALDAKANENMLRINADADRFYGGRARGMKETNGVFARTSAAEANKNKVWVKEDAGSFLESAAGRSSIEGDNAVMLSALAAENELYIRGGTFRRELSGGSSSATNTDVAGDRMAEARAAENKVLVNAGVIKGGLYGGLTAAEAKGDRATASATKNILHLNGGTYDGEIHGGKAFAKTTAAAYAEAIAEENEVHIHGGVYQGDIYAGSAQAEGVSASASHPGSYATVRNNMIEITGANDLSRARLHGALVNAAGTTVTGNALVVRETKSITVDHVTDFQKYTFWIPAGMTEDDTMLTVTSGQGVSLMDAAVEAHLPGSGSTANRLRLLHTPEGTINKNAATTMEVFEGVSGASTATMGITGNGKELIVNRDGSAIDGGGNVTPPPPPQPNPHPPQEEPAPPDETPQPILPDETPQSTLPPATPDSFQLEEDNAKSLAETMAGSAAFLGTGANLLTGMGMTNAAIEAAAAEGFSPFAAMSGTSMRVKTGSHVDVKGMNLAVGFSRELRHGNDRLIFGPIIEYGRGNYDSYVNAAHGNGSIRYIGAGAFMRQEKENGMFYEGSLRAGRSRMDYAADLTTGMVTTHTSYDADANYIGVHVGAGHKTTTPNGTNQELYVRYFYTRQNGADVTLSTGDRYTFSDVDSNILRAGARWMFPQKGGSFILGASMQYEFSGDADATYHRAGGLSYTSASPTLKGFSTSLELGWKAQMSANSTADLSVEGWMGKQRGASFRAGFAWQF